MSSFIAVHTSASVVSIYCQETEVMLLRFFDQFDIIIIN